MLDILQRCRLVPFALAHLPIRTRGSEGEGGSIPSAGNLSLLAYI